MLDALVCMAAIALLLALKLWGFALLFLALLLWEQSRSRTDARVIFLLPVRASRSSRHTSSVSHSSVAGRRHRLCASERARASAR